MGRGRYRVLSDEERLERKKIAQKRWRDNNRERTNAYRAEYNAANRDRFYSEPIAPEALSHVLRDVLPQIELAHRDGNLAVRLKRMQNMIHNGALKVSYGKKIRDKAGNEYGREYSKLPLSFQNLNRKIRNALVNHHIEMSERGVRSDHDLILKYVNERKRILEEVQTVYSCDRDTAKSLLLALINFGTVKGWAWINKVALPPGAETTDIHRFLENYYKQFVACVSELMTIMPELVLAARESLGMPCEYDDDVGDEHLSDKLKLQKRFVHIMLSDAENNVLQAALEYIVRTHKSARVISKMFDGCIVECEDDIACEQIKRHVMLRTGFVLDFEVKPFVSPFRIPTDLDPMDVDDKTNNTPKGKTLDDMVPAKHIVDMIGDKVIRAGDQYYGYNGNSNMWSPGSVNEIVAQQLVHGRNLIFTGVCPISRKDTVRNLGYSSHLRATIPCIPPYILPNNEFLVTKYKSTYRKIKFRNGVYNMATNTFRPSFVPNEYFMVDVPRAFPVRDLVATDQAVDLLKGIYTPKREERKPFDPTFGPEMPLWQFVMTAIALAIAGEVEWKYVLAMIGERNSGKGVVQACITAALRGETFIDGNLVKGIASGGDTLLVRGNHQDPFSVRPEFTMFLNVNDLPVTKPAIGNSMLRIIHPNVYTKNPTKPNHKLADPAIKHMVQEPSFADGMMWAVLDMYREFKASGRVFEPIPQVLSATEDANNDEEEDVFVVLEQAIEFAEPFQDERLYRDGGYFLRAAELKNVVADLKKEGKLKGVSLSGITTRLQNNGYEKKQMRHDGVNNKFFLGMKAREMETDE
eukprot:jgi/Tetstr1/428643/TSEL_018631.t1